MLIPLNCVYGEDGFLARCVVAVQSKADLSCCRVGTSRLGEHLEHMYAGYAVEVVQDGLSPYIQTSLWKAQLEPAVPLIKRAIRSYHQRKEAQFELRRRELEEHLRHNADMWKAGSEASMNAHGQ